MIPVVPKVLSRLLGLALLAALTAVPAGAGDQAPTTPEMKTYQLVLLRRATVPKFQDERAIQATQERYLAWLQRLHEEGKAAISGPVERAGDLDTILVLDVASKDEAAAIVKDDPWVRIGKVVPEIHPWWAPKDAFRKTSRVTRLVACWIGLLRRPPGAPQLPEAKLEEIQEGHLANIRKMAASGDLAVAGPFQEDGVLRGVFIFRPDDPARLRGLSAEDPAVKIGRLAVDLYRWSVPEGAIP